MARAPSLPGAAGRHEARGGPAPSPPAGGACSTASFSSSVPSVSVMLRETRTSVSPAAISPRQIWGAMSSAGRPRSAFGSGSVRRCAWWTRYASTGPAVVTYSSPPRTTATPRPTGRRRPPPRPSRSRWAASFRLAVRIAFSRQAMSPADSS